MRRLIQTLPILTILAAALCLGASGSDATRSDIISVERQLRLKREIMMGQSSLLATLQSNRSKWENSTESERQALREKAMAFRKAAPTRQQRLIDAMERFNALSPDRQAEYRRRAQWIRQVTDRLDETQRQRISQLPPAEKAAELLRLAEAL